MDSDSTEVVDNVKGMIIINCYILVGLFLSIINDLSGAWTITFGLKFKFFSC